MTPLLDVGSAIAAGPLTVFPVWTDAPGGPSMYRNGSFAHLTVAELPQPVVPLLSVTNASPVPHLMLEGTLLDGGHQHRMLVRDVLLPPGRTCQIPVRCVEQARWGGATTHDVDAVAAVSVRTAWVAPVAEDPQHEVWQRIERLHRGAAPGGTRSLVRLQQGLARDVAGLLRPIQPLAGQRGVIVGVAGQPVLLEVFDDAKGLLTRWDALLTSVAVEAVGMPYSPVPARRARWFAAAVQAARPVVREARLGTWATLTLPHRLMVTSLRTNSRLLHSTAVNLRHELALAA